jgi:hypothetical protein
MARPAYLDAASAAVIEMGGKVAKKLGDGLMSLFRANELWSCFRGPPSGLRSNSR